MTGSKRERQISLNNKKKILGQNKNRNGGEEDVICFWVAASANHANSTIRDFGC